MSINSEVFDYGINKKMEFVKIEKKVFKRVEHKYGYP